MRSCATEQQLSNARLRMHELMHVQADQEDLRAFEVASASARSQGLFFKNLYQPEQDPQQQQEQGEGAASSSSSSKRNRMLIDPVAARQAAAVVASSAEDEMASPFRMYLFGYMAAVLALVVLQGEQQHSSRGWRGKLMHLCLLVRVGSCARQRFSALLHAGRGLSS